MCGYFGNLHESPAVVALLNQLNIPLPYPEQRAYQRRKIGGFISANGMDNVIWWYQLKWDEDKFKPNEKVTSFNARDLDKPLWENAIRERRGIVFATEVGESKGKDRYLMRSKEGLALGCVYKDWEDKMGNVTRSMAVITRPPHERFSRYHDKSIPLFLPMDGDFLGEWLDPSVADSKAIGEVLDQPKIRCDFEVTKVKSYKNAEALAEPEQMEADK